jgi:probable phosphoglycerate mutase
MNSPWPTRLWIVRHGQSAGNIARDAALAKRLSHIDIAGRDMDVPLSSLGEDQAGALGRWFGGLPAQERPEVIFASPYRRAIQTSELIQTAGKLATSHSSAAIDERLREKEFGILDRLTQFGIEQTFPEEAKRRGVLGKFYYRPPGGESWCDVILRLRSFIETVNLHHSGQRVLIVAHQVVVLCLRYLLEGLSEDEILAIDRQGDIVNCGLTEYRFEPAAAPGGGLGLVRYNFAAPIEQHGAPVTAEPDSRIGAR